MKNNSSWWRWFPWILGFVVVGTAVYVWASSVRFASLTLYDVFPVLGLTAWSIMWTHYVIGMIRKLNPALPSNPGYSKVSEYIVLAAILLHPGLLALAQFQNGLGLPPASEYAFVAASSAWAITLAIIAWLTFLSFELFNRMKNNVAVKKNWWLVNLSQSVAMLFIFAHSLTVGRNLQSGWFRTYWLVLGVILIACIVHSHWSDYKKSRS